METMMPPGTPSQKEITAKKKQMKEFFGDPPKKSPEYYESLGYTQIKLAHTHMDSLIIEDSAGGLWVA
ncbi:MAG: hypothetical protein HYV41_05095 [Candidatus Magasanikbacteria bacterium]|nr:hypothetical protein [Candidatus Magasanikbacteria bacterium]